MSLIISQFTRELEKEAITTRKMLERIPQDKYGWKPHPRSMSLLQLSTHLAELPGWVGMTITTDELNFEENPYEAAVVPDNKTLLDYYEKNLEDARKHLAAAKEEDLHQIWTLRMGDKILESSPKMDVIRMSFSQTIHHRAQLGVFLRLLEVPIPGSYGPSADDTWE